MKKFLIIILSLMGFAALAHSQEKSYIQNDTFWYTVEGVPINSQGGGIFRFTDPETGEGHYYWYGVHYNGADTYRANPTKKNNDTSFASVTCYYSDDLLNWHFVNDVITPDFFEGHDAPGWIGRMGVAYIEELGLYAIVIQYNSSVLIATCDTPGGDFKWHNNFTMTDMIGTPNTGDQTVFTDDNGKSYLCYSYGSGRNKIYLSEIGVKNGKIALLDCHEIYRGEGREGNCMFKYNGKYYVCGSLLYGWNASYPYYLEAENIYGPYTPKNNMQIIPGSEDDYGHVTQTGFFYTVKGDNQETVIYCGDRWADFAGNGLGYNQWCPISFDNDKPYFNSLSQWTIDDITGEWSVGDKNNYVKNGSFEADRVKIPSAAKPVQDFLIGWSTLVEKGNKIEVGSTNSPVLNASNSRSDRSKVTGNYSLNISDNTAFSRRIYQNITSSNRVVLKDGVYKLEAMVNCSKGFTTMQMYASSDGAVYKTDISGTNGSWKKITVNEIVIKNGEVEVGFIADAQAGSQCRIDDVSLTFDKPVDNNGVCNIYTSDNDRVKYVNIEGVETETPSTGLNIEIRVSDAKITTAKKVIY